MSGIPKRLLDGMYYCWRSSSFSLGIQLGPSLLSTELPLVLFIHSLTWLQIKPLVQPTKDIMREPIRTFQWNEFFPNGISDGACYVSFLFETFPEIVFVFFSVCRK
jgi:hypothetical protein